MATSTTPTPTDTDVAGLPLPTTAQNTAERRPLLVATGMTKRFGQVEALIDVDLELYPGEVVALVGDNGAGKSTMVLWEGQAEAAAAHLVKGQAVAFSGRLEPRPYETSSGERRVAIEVHSVDLEYGRKPRGAGDADAPERGDA